MAAALLAGCGHVTRQLTIDSEPAGALVYLNGQEVGRTPCTIDFTWYGWYDVVLRHDGYQTAKLRQPVLAPWWQWVPIDLLADLTPGRKVDHREFRYTIEPQPQQGVEAAVLIDRANSMRPMLESGELTRHRAIGPATAPAESPQPEPATRIDAPSPIQMQDETGN